MTAIQQKMMYRQGWMDKNKICIRLQYVTSKASMVLWVCVCLNATSFMFYLCEDSCTLSPYPQWKNIIKNVLSPRPSEKSNRGQKIDKACQSFNVYSDTGYKTTEFHINTENRGQIWTNKQKTKDKSCTYECVICMNDFYDLFLLYSFGIAHKNEWHHCIKQQ